MLHALDATLNGHKKIKIRSNDTDVIVLAVSVVNTLAVEELWVTHGSGKNIQNVPVHAIARSLGPEKSTCLPIFHALTGCDTVSFFGGRGKKTAWDVWNVFPELTVVLKNLKASPESITEVESMDVLERSRSIDNIPPTQAALHQHIRRALYQGAHVWGQTLLRQPVLPNPSDWGWHQEDNLWSPHWSLLPQAKDTCHELIRCGCKTSCRGRCKCFNANLVCTALCKCGGNCQH
ncbi:hypothetical protein AC249_AIPGENE28202 [Exaiptasia diaphana]|nr:hypothetical protein AC249_AIPGENE28202 [Exaiptasia diaphana]